MNSAQAGVHVFQRGSEGVQIIKGFNDEAQ